MNLAWLDLFGSLSATMATRLTQARSTLAFPSTVWSTPKHAGAVSPRHAFEGYDHEGLATKIAHALARLYLRTSSL